MAIKLSLFIISLIWIYWLYFNLKYFQIQSYKTFCQWKQALNNWTSIRWNRKMALMNLSISLLQIVFKKTTHRRTLGVSALINHKRMMQVLRKIQVLLVYIFKRRNNKRSLFHMMVLKAKLNFNMPTTSK